MSESGTVETNVDFDTALAAFGADVRALYYASGVRSYRELNVLSKKAGRRVLSPSGISDVFNAKRLPSQEYIIELVRLLTSSPATADPEAERRRWAKRWEDMRKLHDDARAATAGREDPTAPNVQAAAELGELRTERDSLSARINSLTDQQNALSLQIEELTKRATAAETLAEHLQEALYTYWPPGGVRLEAPHRTTSTSVVFHPDGRVLAVGYGDGMLRSWDPDSAKLIGGVLASHDGPVHCVAYCGNGDVLVTGGGDGTVRLADPRTVQLLGAPLVRSGPPVLAAAFSPRRKHCTPHWQYSLAVGDQSGTVRVWTFSDLPQGDANFIFAADGPVQSLAFVPDHDALVVATEFGSVTVRGHDGSAVRDGASVLGFTGDATVRSLCFGSASGVLAVGDAVGRVHLLVLSADEPFSGEQLDNKFDARFPIQSVAASPVSPLLAIGGANGLILWEFNSRRTLVSPPINGEVRSVAFRPDGGLIAMGMANGSTQLHTVPTEVDKVDIASLSRTSTPHRPGGPRLPA